MRRCVCGPAMVTAGGGFAGARTRPFTAPLDLSAFDGLALRVVCEGDGEPERRTWKATVRTQRGRGEEVYQAAFVPPTVPDSDVFLPWESFKLVRGPRAAPNAPPLMAAACTEVYGLGFVLSRFKEPAPGQPPSAMEDFREGPFRLALWAMGVYLRDRTREADARGAVASAPRPPPLPPPEAPPRLSEVVGGDETANTGRARRGPLAPILAFVFSEAARRRKRARVLLQRRYGIGQGQSRLLGQRLKRARGLSPSGAAAEGLLQLARDGVAFVAALPIKLLFRALRLVAMLKRRFAGGKQRVAP